MYNSRIKFTIGILTSALIFMGALVAFAQNPPVSPDDVDCSTILDAKNVPVENMRKYILKCAAE